jgi:urease accessory protein UreF
MSELVTATPAEAARLAGDPRALAQQMAAPAGLAALASVDRVLPMEVRDVPSLRGFLTWYRTQVLVPVELPAIRRAWEHTERYEVRELVAFDRALGEEPRLAPLAAASQAVGRNQLWRLLPLRDQRLVRRYWLAVEAGEARAWHVLVYGVVLSVFSLPLRPGLLSYSRQTLGGFVDAAGRSLRLTQEECAQVWHDEAALLPPSIDLALGLGRAPLQICE